jgi:hypothetical protein
MPTYASGINAGVFTGKRKKSIIGDKQSSMKYDLN